jgi:hypothetical protein
MFQGEDTRDVKLFFEDEGRFGRSNNVCRCWSPKGCRPEVHKQIVRQYTYAFTSVCPETGDIHSLILPYSNTETMNYYLNDLANEFNYYRIILCTDQAGWHISHQLKVPDNIVFMYLPPYSPQLNPVEHIWDYIREQKGFNNRVFNSMDELTVCLSNTLHHLSNEKNAIRKLCNFKWL